jgi:hypothetical protein
MKEGSKVLYSPVERGDKVSRYAEEYSTQLPKAVLEYHASISATRPDADMLASLPQSQLHVFLARALGVKRGT